MSDRLTVVVPLALLKDMVRLLLWWADDCGEEPDVEQGIAESKAAARAAAELYE